MLKYKNISCRPLTFYGVTFNPNEIKEVSGYINHPQMIRVTELKEVEKPKAVITEPPKSTAEPVTKKSYTKKNKNQ